MQVEKLSIEQKIVRIGLELLKRVMNSNKSTILELR